jgi:RES domain
LTPDGLFCNKPYQTFSTPSRLADSLADQSRLEELAEAAKADLPRAAWTLHDLLASPFRYGHHAPSRFRSADERPGIFYASEHEATAIAETAYWLRRCPVQRRQQPRPSISASQPQ